MMTPHMNVLEIAMYYLGCGSLLYLVTRGAVWLVSKLPE
jgi:hypothetical protein